MRAHKTGWDLLYLAVGAIACLCALALLIAGVWVAVAIAFADGGDARAGRTAARAALRDTGLETAAQQASVDSALRYDTYFRDGDETVIFQVGWGSREEIWQAVCGAPGWRACSVTAADYTALARAEFWGPNDVVAPAADVVFDAWFYRDDYHAQYGEYAGSAGRYAGLPESLGLNGSPDTLNATFAFYDRETGAFFYHAYDT